ncbi:unnamed protein product, partial [Prorocentrum cordatum]
EMKDQVEADAKEDADTFAKHKCWCETNEKEKQQAVERAKARIEELESAIEGGTALAARLGSEIEGLKEEIQEDRDALDKAAAMREEERADFESEEKDSMECLAALKERHGGALQGPARPESARRAAHRRSGRSGPTRSPSRRCGGRWSASAGARAASMPRRRARETRGARARIGRPCRRRPLGRAWRPPRRPALPCRAGAGPAGAARGGCDGRQVLQREERTDPGHTEADGGHLHGRLAGGSEVGGGGGDLLPAPEGSEDGGDTAVCAPRWRKSAELADTNDKVAQAKEDVVSTGEALSADEKFLVDLEAQCESAGKEFDERVATRADEVKAIAEAITILSQDR